MGATAKAWTAAIEQFLADGKWHDTEEALQVGAAVVPEERALHEMGDRQSSHPTERRIKIGQRNVAQQAVTGMVRFGKAGYSEGKRKIRWLGAASRSLGETAATLDDLQAKVTELTDLVETYNARLEFLEGLAAGEHTPAEKLLATVGLSSDN